MPETKRILLLPGSLRAQSTNLAALRTAAAAAPRGVEATLYDGLATLPPFNPDDDPEGGAPPAPVAALRAALGAADALLVCTPEYAGALPGAFKNLLDWSVGGGETYGMPVGWINVSGPAAPSGGTHAHDELRRVFGYTGAVVVEPACLAMPLSRRAVGEDGLIADEGVRRRLAAVLAALAGAVGAD